MCVPALGMTKPDLLLQWSTQIAKAGLDGRSETELVDLLCANLRACGFDLDAVEVACDVVDPERTDRFFVWRQATATAEADSIALPLFEHVLGNRLPMLRYRAG